MMTDKILSQMAKFDFSAPIQMVTMFDDDSDQENCSSSPKKQKYDDCSIKASLHHEVDISSSSDEEIFIKKEIERRNDCVKENEEHKGDKAAINDENFLCCNSENMDTSASKPNEQNCSNSINLQNEESVVNGNNVDDNHKEPQTPHDKIPASSGHIENISDKTIPEQVNTATTVNNSDLSKDNEIMSAYLKKLINTVSEHLLLILRAYRYYLNAQNVGNQILIEKSKKQYFQLKNHYFNLSFLVVETIFLPQVHSQPNYTFARNFIECTLRIAKTKSIRCSFEHIEPLYLEMLEWTKRKSEHYKKLATFYLKPKSHNMVLSNETSIEMKKQIACTQNVHAQNVNLSIYQSVGCTTGPQRDENLTYQTHFLDPKLTSRPILPDYNTAINLQRSTVNSNNAYKHCKSHNNLNTKETNGPSNFCRSKVSNNSLNVRMGRETYFQNHGQYQNCVYCPQTQGNMALPRAIPIPNIYQEL